MEPRPPPLGDWGGIQGGCLGPGAVAWGDVVGGASRASRASHPTFSIGHNRSPNSP